MENLEAKTFDQRGWIMFKSNRVEKCGFHALTVHAAVEKVSLIQGVCTKQHCQSPPSFSSALRLWLHSDHWHKMCVWWKGEGGISLFPLLLCFVMFCVCSVCLQDQRSDSESYFHNRRAWENTNISLLKTHSPVYHTLTCLTFCLLELLSHELPYFFL